MSTALDFLRALIDQMPAGLMVIDGESHIVETVNEEAARLLGKPASQLVGRSCGQVLCREPSGACPVTC